MTFRLYILIIVPFAILLICEAENFHFSDGNDKSTIKQHNRESKGKEILYNEVQGNARMFGIDTGNSATDFEAGMWLMALLGTLAAAVPVAFLSPGLGFKKRSIDQTRSIEILLKNFNSLKNIYMSSEETRA